jgi:hypothetical protein
MRMSQADAKQELDIDGICKFHVGHALDKTLTTKAISSGIS